MCTCGEGHKITRTLSKAPGYVKVNIQLYDLDKLELSGLTAKSEVIVPFSET